VLLFFFLPHYDDKQESNFVNMTNEN